MSKKIDRETEEALLNAIARLYEDEERFEQKMEVRLWAETAVPCKLSDALAQLTKNELDDIRRNLEVKGLSSLNKKRLAEELERLLPEMAQGVFSLFDEERYRLVKKICENGGFTFDKGLPSEKAAYFRRMGVIFTGSRNGRKIVYMPLELVDAFRAVDSQEYRKMVRRNTEWTRIAAGLLYYYGYMDLTQMVEMVGDLTGEKPEILMFIRIMYDAALYHEQIRPELGGFADDRVPDAEVIRKERSSRPELGYRPFNRQQLVKAGTPGYIDWTPPLRVFMEFLQDCYELSDDEVDELADECLEIINSAETPGELLKYLESFLEFPSLEFVQELTGLMMVLFNNTRMWALKGYTPQELSVQREEQGRLNPKSPAAGGRPGSKVIDFQTRKEVGRNDPCPCGSGKKFKKCCGK